jgi:hypothetical protein
MENLIEKEEKNQIISQMDKAGYHYDKIESTDDNIRFNYNMQVFPLTFTSWQEVKEYVNEVDEHRDINNGIAGRIAVAKGKAEAQDNKQSPDKKEQAR